MVWTLNVIKQAGGLDKDGELPRFAWPGGYPLYYLAGDWAVVCAVCANTADFRELDAGVARSVYTSWPNGEMDRCDNGDSLQWRIDAVEVNWEQDDLFCAHCGENIESAYGENLEKLERHARKRFDLFGALWAFCSRWHGGQDSRGYRILSRLTLAGYEPSHGLQSGHFESDEQRAIYRRLLAFRKTV